MQIEVKIDSTCAEPKVIIVTDKMTEEVQRIMSLIADDSPQVLSGFKGDVLVVIDPADILRIYAGSNKVFAVTADGEYLLRLRLYEVEKRLDKHKFVRISNSEIVNLKKVKSFDLSFVGTICVQLSDGTSAFVSRRYVNKIKQILGI